MTPELERDTLFSRVCDGTASTEEIAKLHHLREADN